MVSFYGGTLPAVAAAPGWHWPLSVAPDRPVWRDHSLFSDSAWLAAVPYAASVVPTAVTWQNAFSTPHYMLTRTRRLLPSITDAASYADAWISPPVVPDPFFSSVVLLMGFEGIDASTSAPGMADESLTNNKGTATVTPNAQIDTAQFKFGTSSLLLDGSGDLLRFVDSADYNLASGSFTIECRIRPATVAAATYFIVGQWQAAPNLGWLLYQSTAGLFWNVSTTGSNNLNDIGVAGVLSANTWYAVAIDFDGTKYRLYLDGVMVGSSTTARAIFDSPLRLSIGSSDLGSGFFFNGWIDEMRITKGVARYASDGGYTVATIRFPRS